MRRWGWPFLWVLLIPAISVPLSVFLQSHVTLYDGAEVDLGGGGPWAKRESALGVFSPVMLNLVALAWLFFGDGRARWAALWAGMIGAVGAILPFFIIVNTDSLGPDNTHYVYWIPTASLVWLGAFNAWLATLLAALVFRIFTQARDRIRAVDMAFDREEPYLSPAHSH